MQPPDPSPTGMTKPSAPVVPPEIILPIFTTLMECGDRRSALSLLLLDHATHDLLRERFYHTVLLSRTNIHLFGNTMRDASIDQSIPPLVRRLVIVESLLVLDTFESFAVPPFEQRTGLDLALFTVLPELEHVVASPVADDLAERAYGLSHFWNVFYSTHDWREYPKGGRTGMERVTMCVRPRPHSQEALSAHYELLVKDQPNRARHMERFDAMFHVRPLAPLSELVCAYLEALCTPVRTLAHSSPVFNEALFDVHETLPVGTDTCPRSILKSAYEALYFKCISPDPSTREMVLVGARDGLERMGVDVKRHDNPPGGSRDARVRLVSWEEWRSETRCGCEDDPLGGSIKAFLEVSG